jgi:hypothetical protein
MKIKIIVMFLMLSHFSIQGQMIDPHLISFSGNSISNGTYSLDYSLGEILIETLTDSISNCTQGLLQPNYNSVIEVSEIDQYPISVFPNPVTDNIRIFSDHILKSEIINGIGNLVGRYNSNEISISEFQSGVYYMRIFNINGIPMKTLTIIKK